MLPSCLTRDPSTLPFTCINGHFRAEVLLRCFEDDIHDVLLLLYVSIVARCAHEAVAPWAGLYLMCDKGYYCREYFDGPD